MDHIIEHHYLHTLPGTRLTTWILIYFTHLFEIQSSLTDTTSIDSFFVYFKRPPPTIFLTLCDNTITLLT